MPPDTKCFRISATHGKVHITGDLDQSVSFSADGFFAGLLKTPSSRCLDFLHIAAGAYAIDRIVKKSDCGGFRSLHLTVEVHELAFWTQAEIGDAITELLCFLSGDNWSIAFERAITVTGDFGYQNWLELPQAYQPKRIALYSGGLDSAAGLANRLINGVGGYLLLTIGHQSLIRKSTINQLRDLQTTLAIPKLLHSTLVTRLSGGKAALLRDQEKTQRTRAFLFCACAVVAANAFNLKEIEIFENGIGAINFPLMTGMLVGGLATRGSHPSFLKQMAILASAVTESKMQFSLPFAEMTKGEMLRPLHKAGLANWAQQSRSCIHTSWRAAGISHCGKCPACIERRQAFAVANIQEDNIYSTDIFRTPLKPSPNADYFSLYKEEASAWLSKDPRTLRRMMSHLRSTDIPTDRDQIIFELQTRHAHEVVTHYVQSKAEFHNSGDYAESSTQIGAVP